MKLRRPTLVHALVGLLATGALTIGLAAPAQAATRSLTSTPTPTISGVDRVSSTLSAHHGTWSPAPVTFTYQWYRSGAAIAGATKSSYKLVNADAGKTVAVRVTGAKSGYHAVAKSSKATPTITGGKLTAPTPTISGTLAAGSVLSAHHGTWSPAAVSFRYQWLRSGVAITGATKSSYELGTADIGATIVLRVTGSKTGFASLTTVSKATSAVKLGTFSAAPTPSIRGTVQVDATVTAVHGTWSPSATLSYQWKLNGAAIAGATASTFTPGFSAEGGALSVAVTGKRSGYATKTVTSPALTVGAPSQLRNGEILGVNQSLRSPSGGYSLVMQSDGNLVEYGPSGAVWSSNTAGSGSDHLALQPDGNLVVYTSAVAAKWASGTNGFGAGVTLSVQDDANLVLYRAGTAIWTRAVVRWITVGANAKSGSTPGTQSMSGPTLQSTQYGVYAPGARVPVVCGTPSGQGVTGAYSSAKDGTWHRLLTGDWVPDADFYTGTNGLFSGEPDCTPAGGGVGASKIDAYVSAHPAGSEVGDGQCVALVKDYLTSVWGEDANGRALGNGVDYRSGGVGGQYLAAHGWTWSTDQNFQTGDILVWGAGADTNQYGHVAIYYPHGSTRLYEQNGAGANSLRVFFGNYFSSGYLGHWHHN